MLSTYDGIKSNYASTIIWPIEIEMRPRYHWGPSLWKFIHTITIIDFVDVISILHGIIAMMPCKKCIQSYQDFLQCIGPAQYERMELFRYGIEYHNIINKKLGKAVISYQDAVDLWCTT
jgi:hypothetical protein